MRRALACYGDDDDLERILDHMSGNETEAMILHELGEVMAGDVLGHQWEEMLATLPRSSAELIARAVRDLLADCLVTLPSMLSEANEASLHFYFSNLTGMRGKLFPEALVAYERWAESSNSAVLRDLCCRGRDRWQEQAEQILAAYREYGPEAPPAIEALFSTTLPN
jgi:hypothetical protein